MTKPFSPEQKQLSAIHKQILSAHISNSEIISKNMGLTQPYVLFTAMIGAANLLDNLPNVHMHHFLGKLIAYKLGAISDEDFGDILDKMFDLFASLDATFIQNSQTTSNASMH